MTYHATTEGVAAVDGVEVDITVRGNEDKAEKVMMDLKERMGRLGAAFERDTPPSELPEYVGEKYTPLMTVAWDRVFDADGVEQ